MTVLLVNGSPHEHGCTDTALREVASAVEAEGLETEFFWIGNKPINGCIGCRLCEKECHFDAIHVVDNHAVIDYDKCKNCGLCAKKCPRGVIVSKPRPGAKPKVEVQEG